MISDKVKREYYSYLLSAVKKMPKRKFVLFGQGRSGSTLLIELLNSHPDVSAHKEIMNTSSSAEENVVPFKYPYGFVKGVAVRCRKKVYGYKTKVYQIEGHKVDPKKFIKKHVKEGWRVVHLWRKNTFNQALSGEKASKTDIWHQRNNDEKKLKIKLKPENVLERVRFRRKKLEQEKKIMKDIESIEVIYERDLLGKEKQQSTCNKIFDYLEIERRKVESSLRKMNRVKVENTEEIKNFVEEKIEPEVGKPYL